MLLCAVFRLVSRAQTSLRRHGELGAERLCGAEDPVGRRGILVIISDGADHGGRPRNLPPGRDVSPAWTSGVSLKSFWPSVISTLTLTT